MAATILNVGSKFNPLSFDEMVKPYLMYKQEADKTEAAINDYTEKGDVIGSLIDPNRDTEASALYNQFNEAAQSAITNFYNNGYTPDVKKSLLNLRKNYATNMSKIQAAYTAREKERAMQNELKAKDPTMMFSRDANYESLDSYLMGKQPTFNSVSGDYLYKLGLQAGKSASTRQDLTVEARKALENTYWELKQNQGFTDSQALEYMKDTNPMFNSIVSNIRNGSNIDSLNPNDQERANSAILNGILSGLVGEQKVDYKPVINVNVNTEKSDKDGDDKESPTYPIFTAPSIIGNTSNVSKKESKQINKDYNSISGQKMITGVDGKQFITSEDGSMLYSSYENAFNNRKHKDITQQEIKDYKPKFSDYQETDEIIPLGGREKEVYELNKAYNKFTKEQDRFKSLYKDAADKGSYLGDFGDEGITNAMLYTALKEKQKASQYATYTLNLKTDIGNNISNNLGDLIESVGAGRPVLFKVSEDGRLVDTKGNKSEDFSKAQLFNAVISRDSNGRLIATIRGDANGTSGKSTRYYISGDEQMKSAEEIFNIAKATLNNFNEQDMLISSNLIGGTNIKIPGIKRTEDRAEVDDLSKLISDHSLVPFNSNELSAYNARPIISSSGEHLYNVIDIESGGDIYRILTDPNGYIKHISSLYDILGNGKSISDFINTDNASYTELMKNYFIQK